MHHKYYQTSDLFIYDTYENYDEYLIENYPVPNLGYGRDWYFKSIHHKVLCKHKIRTIYTIYLKKIFSIKYYLSSEIECLLL